MRGVGTKNGKYMKADFIKDHNGNVNQQALHCFEHFLLLIR